MRTHVLPILLLSFFHGYSDAATLLHSYNFNDGTANDLVGDANGTFFGNATVIDQALLLDGSGDYVELNDKVVPGSGSYSIALRVRVDSTPTGYVEFISQGFTIDTGGGVPGGTPGFFIGHDPNGVIRATDAWLNTGVSIPTVGTFNHYALVVDAAADTSILYVNGISRVSRPDGAIFTDSTGSNTRFGRQFESIEEYLTGAIDDVQIYSGALTAGEVATLSAIPEPNVLSVTGSMIAFLAFFRRRKGIL